MQNKINCTVPGFEEILGNDNSFPQCKDNISANHTLNRYLDVAYEFLQNPNIQNCQKPCKQTVFKSKVKKEHVTSWISDTDDNVFYLRIVYSTLNIEQNVETLVYDAGSFLAALGGNLGLFLGFSCLSCILTIINLTKKKIVGFK